MRLIDADALEALHCEECGAVARRMCEEDPVCATLMWLREAPTINPADLVPKGRWVDDPQDPRFVCEECGKWLLIEDGTADMNFCPNCGADMREVPNED